MGLFLRRLLGIMLLLWIPNTALLAQNATFKFVLPSGLSTCGTAKTFTTKIYNTSSSDSLGSNNLTVRLPAGIYYVPGSVTGNGAVETSISNLQAPRFRLSKILASDSALVTISVQASCGIQTFIAGGGLVRNTSILTSNKGTDSAVSFTYPVVSPSISISSVTQSSFTGNVNDTFSRLVTIRNTGQGPLDSLVGVFINGNGLKVDTIVGLNRVIRGDTSYLYIKSAYISQYGDFDGFLEQNESIAIRVKYTIKACTQLSSRFQVQWGCIGQVCQSSFQTGGVIITNTVPSIVVTPNGFLSNCYVSTTSSPQSLRVSNQGSGSAYNVELYIGAESSPGAGFNWGFYTKIDTSTVTIGYNGAATPTKLKPDSIWMNYTYTCLGSNPIGKFKVMIPEIKAGEYLDLKWNTYTCCVDQGYVGSWTYQGRYNDQCQNTVYPIAPGWGRVYSANIWGAHYANTTDLIVGDTINYFLTNNSNNNQLLPGVGNSYIQYEMIMPPGAKIISSTIRLINSANTVSVTPDSVTVSGTTYRATFKTGSLNYNFSRLEFKIVADTAGSGTKCGDLKTMKLNVYYVPRVSCACKSGLIRDVPFDMTFNCVNPNKVGLVNRSFTVKRSTFGLPDNNDDGAPDASGSLDLTKIRLDRAMFGDTVLGEFKGTVKCDTQFTDWRFAFAYLRLSNNLLQHVRADIKIWDSSTNTTYTLNNIPYRRTGNFLYYFFSTDTLRNRGISFNSSWRYQSGDSIYIKFSLRASPSSGGAQYVEVANEFYFSDKRNPTFLYDRYYVNNNIDDITAYGYYLVNWGQESYTVDGCNTLATSQGFFLGVGPCCNSYNGSNPFEYEYRYWASIKELRMKPPAGYSLLSYDLIQYTTKGNGVSHLETLYGLTNYNSITGGYSINMDSLFNNGSFRKGDDGWYGGITARWIPDCSLPSGTSTNLTYEMQFSVNKQLIASGLSTWYNGNDNITYKKPTLTVQPSLTTITKNNDTFSVRVVVSNTSLTGLLAKPWLYFNSVSGDIRIDSVVHVAKNKGQTKAFDYFQLDSLLAGKSETYLIKGIAKNCILDNIDLSVGWACKSYPTSAGPVCNPDNSESLYLEPTQPALEMRPVTSNDSVALCDTSTFSFEVRNINPAGARNIYSYISLPQGAKVLPSTSELLYPLNASTYKSIPDPTSLDAYSLRYNMWNADSTIKKFGLVGNQDTSKSAFRIRFKAVTDCDYISGGWIDYRAVSLNNCLSPTSATATQSKALKIIGAAEPYFTSLAFSGSSDVFYCSDGTIYKIKVAIPSGSTTDTGDYVRLQLPNQLEVNPQYLVGVRNTPTGLAQVQELATTNRYAWRLPSGITGDSAVFYIKIKGGDNGSCDNYAVTLSTTAQKPVTCVSTSTVCAINVQTGRTNATISLKKSKVTFSQLKIKSEVNGTTGEKLTVQVGIKAEADTLRASKKPIVKYYFDKDGNGALSVGDELIKQDTIATNIAPDSTYSYSFTLTQAAGKGCRILAYYDTSGTNCNCVPSWRGSGEIPLESTGSDTTICYGASYLLGKDSISGYSYVWSPDSLVSNDSIARPIMKTVTGKTTAVTHKLYLVTNRGGCSTRDSMLVTIAPRLSVNVGGDRTICEQNSTSIGSATSTTGGTAPYRYRWTPATSLSSDTILNPSASPTTTTTYKLTVIDAIGCVAQDSLIVNVNPKPNVDLGVDRTICQQDTITLSGSTAVSGGTNPMASYQWSPSTGLSNANTANPKAYPSTTTQYVLRVVDNKGCEDQDTFTIWVNPKPSANAGSNRTICEADSTILGSASVASGGTAPYSYRWTPASELNDSTAANPVARPSTTRTYNLLVIDSRGCTARSSVLVTVNQRPLVSAGADKEVCFSDSIAIGGSPTASGGGGGYVYKWWPRTGLSDSTKANPKASPLTNTRYYVQVIDSKGCTRTDSMDLVVNPLPIVSIPSRDTICRGSSYIVTGTASGSYTYRWIPGTLAADSTVRNATLTPDSTTTFVLQTTGVGGCSVYDTLTVFVRDTTKLAGADVICNQALFTTAQQIVWNKHTQNPFEFASYEIYRAVYPGSYQFLKSVSQINDTSFVDTTATGQPTVGYTYAIAVKNKCGAIGAAGKGKQSIKIETIPFNDKEMGLWWNSDADTSVVSSLELLRANGTTVELYRGKSRNFVWKSCGDSGQLRIRELDACGRNSAYTPVKTLRDKTPGVSPTLLSADVKSHGSILLTLKKPTYSDFKDLVVYRKRNNQTPVQALRVTLAASVDTFQWLDTSLLAGSEQYTYTVSSVDSCGNESARGGAHKVIQLQGQAGNHKSELKWNTYQGRLVTNQWVSRWNGSTWQNIASLSASDSLYTDTGLSCLVPQYYRIQVRFGGGTLVHSDSIRIVPFDTIKPQTPDIIRVSQTGAQTKQVSLYKVAAPDVVQYWVFRSRNGGAFQKIGDINRPFSDTLSYTDGNAGVATDSIVYRVQAMDSCNGNISAVSVAHGAVVLRAQALNYGARIEWSKYNGFAIKQQQLQVKMGTSWSSIKTWTDGTSQFMDTPLVCNVRRVYRVYTEGFNAGEYSFSDTLGVVPFDTIAPVQVVVRRASVVQNSKIELNWLASPEIDVRAYEVQRKVNNGAWQTLNSYYAGISYLDSTASNVASTAYCYRVRAVDSCARNAGPWSVTHCSPVLQVTKDGCIRDLNTDWGKYVGVSGQQTYLLRRSLNGGAYQGHASQTNNDTNYVDAALSMHNQYCYQLATVLSNGDTTWTAEVCNRIYFTDTPHILYVNVEATNNVNGGLKVKWADQGTTPLLRYHKLYYRAPGSAGFSLLKDSISVGIDSFMHTGLDTRTSKHSYYLVNVDSCGGLSEQGRAHRNIDMEFTVGQLDHRLAWNAYTGWPVKSYRIEQRLGGVFQELARVNAPDTDWVRFPAPCNRVLYYRVVAEGYNGLEAISDTVGNQAKDSIPTNEAKPISITVLNNGQTQIQFTTSDSADTYGYFVQRKGSSGSYQNIGFVDHTMPGDMLQFVDTSLADAGPYYYRTVAVDSCINETPSGGWNPTFLYGYNKNLGTELHWRRIGGAGLSKQWVLLHNGASWDTLATLNGMDSQLVHAPLNCNVPRVYKIASELSSNGFMSLSDSLTLTPFDTIRPQAPQIVGLSVNSTGSLTTIWRRSTSVDVDKYRIEYSSNGGAWTVAATTQWDTTYTITGLQTRTNTYTVRVYAIDSCANNTSLIPSYAVMSKLDGAPKNLSNDLTWSKVQGISTAQQTVELWDGTQWITTSPTLQAADSLWTHTPLNCNVKRSYRIRINYATGEQGYTDTLSLTPFDTIRPQAPEILSLSVPSSGTLVAIWKRSASNDVDRYRVEVSSNGGAWALAGTTNWDTTLTINGLQTKTNQYRVRVFAIDSCRSNISAVPSYATMTRLAGLNMNLSNDLNWNKLQGITVAQQQVEEWDGSQWNAIGPTLPQTDSNWLHTPINCNVKRSYRLAISYDNGLLGYTDTLSLTPYDTIKPEAPKNLFITVKGGDTLLVDWNKSSSVDADRYAVWVHGSGANKQLQSILKWDTSFTTRGFNLKDSSYCWGVRAIDSCKDNTSDMSVLVCPGKLLGAGAQLANDLQWTKPTINRTLTSIQVQRRDAGVWTAIANLNPSATQYQDAPLNCNVAREYRLAFQYQDGRISHTQSISLKPFDTIPPLAPTLGVMSVIDRSTISVTWNKSSNVDVDRYDVQLQKAGVTQRVLRTKWDTSIVLTGLSIADSTYCVQVLAIDSCADNRSVASTPHCLTQMDGTAGNLQTYLNWSQYSGVGIDSQVVERKLANAAWGAIEVLNGSATSYNDTGLACHVNYTYRLKSYLANGLMSVSDSITLAPFDTLKPNAPYLKRISYLGGGRTEIVWHHNPLSENKFYEVRRLDGVAGTEQVLGTVLRDSVFVDNSTLGINSKDYSYSIIAIDSCSSNNRSEPSVPHQLPTLLLSTRACVPLIRVQWSAYQGFTEGINKVEVYRSADGQPMNLVKTLANPGTYWVDSSVEIGSYYTYQLKSISNKGQQAWGDTLGLTPWQYPLAEIVKTQIVSVVGTGGVGKGSVGIRWDAHNPADTFARGYRIWRKDMATGLEAKVLESNDLSMTTFVDSTADTRAGLYSYRVVKYNLCDVDGATQVLHEPLQLDVQVGNLSHTLRWSTYKGWGAALTGYTVERLEEGATWTARATLPITDTTWIDNSLRCELWYGYRVVAQHSSLGIPSYSDTVMVRSWDTIAPKKVQILAVNVEESNSITGQIKLTWKQDSKVSRKSYQILRTSNGLIYNPWDMRYDLAGVSADATDTFRNTLGGLSMYVIRALDSCGNTSTWSDTMRPMQLKVKAVNAAIECRWTELKGPMVYAYAVERKTKNTNWVRLAQLGVDQRFYADSSGKCDTVYTYRIVGMDSPTPAYNSWSNTDTAVFYEVNLPEAPMMQFITVAATGFTKGAVRINWEASVAKDVAYYRLYRLINGQKLLFQDGVTALTWLDTGLNTYENNYRYVVEAVDSCDNISDTSSLSHRTILLETIAGDERVSLRWNAYQGWAPQAMRVFRDGVKIVDLPGIATQYIDTGVVCPEVYSYRVAAIHPVDTNWQSFSNMSNNSPYDLTPPKAVSLFSASVVQANNVVKVIHRRSPSKDVFAYALYRQVKQNGNFLEIARHFDLQDTVFTDTLTEDMDFAYCYRIAVIDRCGNQSILSNDACAMILQGKSTKENHAITWNPYKVAELPLTQYNIYRILDGQPRQWLAQVSAGDTSYVDTAFAQEAMSYCYEVEAVTQDTLFNSISTQTCLQQNPTIFIPSAFSPEVTQNQNDWFGPVGRFVPSYYMEIQSRWGDLLFQTNDSGRWDGKYKGKYVEMGAYIYIIKVTGPDKKTIRYSGMVTVVR